MTDSTPRAAALERLVRAAALPPAQRDALAALDAAQLEQLALLIEQARERDRRELHDAIHAGLQHVPRLLRGAVVRILGG